MDLHTLRPGMLMKVKQVLSKVDDVDKPVTPTMSIKAMKQGYEHPHETASSTRNLQEINYNVKLFLQCKFSEGNRLITVGSSLLSTEINFN